MTGQLTGHMSVGVTVKIASNGLVCVLRENSTGLSVSLKSLKVLRKKSNESRV